ncbi:uncharacterized mitochondrial protein AtMg00710-like [Arachis hypogaea]|uniref:uncharacterized mitochondrial protein AtMg00710-like n=1 Tax=Arachis hypogaea TaxID=3818 RepID=UPI003B2190A7
MEMARCMLHEKELPKEFWAEAANTAVFLQNRLPSKALKDKTPFEAWYGYKPSLTFLKVFGCVCFAHVPQVKRDKLDKKAIPGIFINNGIGRTHEKQLDLVTILKMIMAETKQQSCVKMN